MPKNTSPAAAPEASAESTAEAAAPPTVEQLTQQLAEANAKIEALTANATQAVEDEKVIAEKMRFGLNRQQAIMAIQRQRDFDKKNPTKTVAYHKPDDKGVSQFTRLR